MIKHIKHINALKYVFPSGNSLVVQWLGLYYQGQVRSLAGEVRSYMLCNVAKLKKKKWVSIIKNTANFGMRYIFILSRKYLYC